MIKQNSIFKHALIALFAASYSVPYCLAEDEHVCPDYPDMEQTLDEGRKQLQSLPSTQSKSPPAPIEMDPAFEAILKRKRLERSKHTASEEPKLSYLDAETMVDGIRIKNAVDLLAAYSTSETLIHSHHFDLCLSAWNKMHDFCSAAYGEENQKTAMCKVYQARMHVLIGGNELNDESKKVLLASGLLKFRDVVKNSHSAQYCKGDKQKLVSHWNSAKTLYSQALKVYSNGSSNRITETVRLQLASLHEWSNEFESAFAVALQAYNAQPAHSFAGLKSPLSPESVKANNLLDAFHFYYGPAYREEPVDVLARIVIAHRDWSKAAFLTDEIFKIKYTREVPPERKALAMFLNAFGANHRNVELWSLADRLIDDNDDQTLGDSLSVLIASATEKEKPKLLALLKKFPATIRDARAFEDKGWFLDAEQRYVQLNESNPESNHFEFELAEFYQRRKRWSDAAAVYESLLKSIQQRCSNDADSVKVCSSLLLGVSRSITSDHEAAVAMAKVRNRMQSVRDLCDKRGQEIECLKLAQELYATGSRLEQKGDQKTAKKMYASSLEIREKNLPPMDASKVPVLVDLARIDADEGNAAAARDKFERAVSICQKTRRSSVDSFQYVLETYGDFLSKTNQQKRADEIYGLARTLADTRKLEIKNQD